MRPPGRAVIQSSILWHCRTTHSKSFESDSVAVVLRWMFGLTLLILSQPPGFLFLSIKSETGLNFLVYEHSFQIWKNSHIHIVSWLFSEQLDIAFVRESYVEYGLSSARHFRHVLQSHWYCQFNLNQIVTHGASIFVSCMEKKIVGIFIACLKKRVSIKSRDQQSFFWITE